MSSFEYASVLTSIIVGFALSDMLRSLQVLLRERHKVRWDWAAPLLAMLVALSIIQLWWLLYEPVARPITMGDFLPVLVLLVLLSVLASAVFPETVPEAGLDLRAHYAASAPFVWTVYAVALLWLTGMDVAKLARAGAPLGAIVVNQLVELLIVALMVSLIFVRRRWWHAVAFTALASGPLMWVSRSVG